MTEFMSAMALTHDVISVADKDNTGVYQGNSPDEITLVEFARLCGLEFFTSTDNWALLVNRIIEDDLKM